jgi:predicted nucleic acid-binding Zn ribbon protein
MGYYKNQEIANQVEEPDRLPEPIPAARHIANGHSLTRLERNRLERYRKRVRREDLIVRLILSLAIITIGLIAVLGWIR